METFTVAEKVTSDTTFGDCGPIEISFKQSPTLDPIDSTVFTFDTSGDPNFTFSIETIDADKHGSYPMLMIATYTNYPHV